jgi:hypothetical protein
MQRNVGRTKSPNLLENEHVAPLAVVFAEA